MSFLNEYEGAGYHGYSMSNNAMRAYESGEKPLSKWSKSDMLDAVAHLRPDLVEQLRSMPIATLRRYLLTSTGWHHTGSYYNRTNFYGIDEDYLMDLTSDMIMQWDMIKPKKKQQNKPVTRKGDFFYIEWEGSRKHPRAVEQELHNVNIETRGSFYIVTDDRGRELIRKKIGSNGTHARFYNN